MLSGVGPTRMMERILYSNESKGATITFFYFSSGLVSALPVCHLASYHFPICPSRLPPGFLSLPYLPFLLVCHLASCHFPVCRFFLSATWLPHLPFSTLLPSLLRDNPRKVIGAFRPSPTAWSLAPCSRASWKICLEHM